MHIICTNALVRFQFLDFFDDFLAVFAFCNIHTICLQQKTRLSFPESP